MTLEDGDMIEETPATPGVLNGGDNMEVDQTRESSAGTPPEPSSEWDGEHTWTIENFKDIEERKLYSDPFEIGTYTWRLLIFPRGNESQRAPDYISVYLDCPDATYTPPHMCPKARFSLFAVNQLDPALSHHKEASHNFTSKEIDWGFTQFLSVSDALDPRKGYLVKDKLVLKVMISVQRDDQLCRLSRKETGFVGLKNQGATCYMNSLLQYLFHIPYFRKAVYHMPTLETDEPEKSIPLALQSLFFKLQYQSSSVNTKDLTKSFGWGTYDSFLQHDIQEMEAILCEKLEEKMKGTKVEKVIQELFVGHYSNYIECVDVDYKSSCKQPFMEIQLDIAGCKDIYASLNKFCEVEKLEGQNKYKAEGYGLVDAKRYTLFDDFPPVLQLHLKRFDYDPMRNMMVKINSHYKFYNELDLDIDERKYLSAASDPNVRNKYRLHSVLVHSGGPHGGHYFGFIRPGSKSDKWFKFDDELVKEEQEKRAIEDQFGDEDSMTMSNFGGGLKYTKQSTAYMLVYVRESDWDRIMCDASKEDIVEHIRRRLEAEQTDKERRQKEKQEAHLYVVIKVACDTDFAKQIGESHHFDLVNFDNVKSYRIHKKTLFSEFQQRVAEDFGVPVDLQRYWLWSNRQNGTTRPDQPLVDPHNELKTVLDLRQHKEKNLFHSSAVEKHALMTVKLYIEKPDPSGMLKELNPSDLLVFCKLYDPFRRKLSYVGHIFVDKAMPFKEIFKVVKKLSGLDEAVEIVGYEEVKFEPSVMCNELKESSTPDKSQFLAGDIICIQQKVTQEMIDEHELRHPTVKSFLEYIQNSKIVNFRPLDNPKNDGFKLEMLKTMSYEEVTKELASHLNVEDPQRIRLTQHNVYAHAPQKAPVKYNGIENLENLILHSRQYTNILYYEVLDMAWPYLEKLKCMRIQFHNEKAEMESEHQIRLLKDKTVADLVDALKEKLGKDYADKEFRVMEVLSSRIYKIRDPSTTLEQLHETYWTFRAEVIPPEEESLGPDEHLFHVCHFKPDEKSTSVATFGDPFWLRISKGESLADLKPRIKEKLGVSDEEFEKWKFAYHPRQMQPVEYLSDSEEVLGKFPRVPSHIECDTKYYGDSSTFLGLEHEDTQPARRTQQPARYLYERGVKIYSD